MARVPRLARVLPLDKDRPALKMVTDGIPKQGEAVALIDLFEDEAALLAEQPSAAQIEDLYRNRWFRYCMIRLKDLHNLAMTEAFSAEDADFPRHKGRVQGMRQALGLVGAILDEAHRREPRKEEAQQEPEGMEYPDFPEELAGPEPKE